MGKTIVSLWARKTDTAPNKEAVVASPVKKPVVSVAKPKPAPVVTAPLAAKAVSNSKETKKGKEKVASKEKGKKSAKAAKKTKPASQPVVVADKVKGKRGRPSNAEVAARKQATAEAERKEKIRLLALIEDATVDETTGSVSLPVVSTNTKAQTPVVLPTHQLFQVAERVKLKTNSYFPDGPQIKGTIVRHDIGSAFALVFWDDKCQDWRHADVLDRIQDQKGKGKKRGRKPKVEEAQQDG